MNTRSGLLRLSFFLSLVALVFARPAGATDLEEIARLTASDAQASDLFGDALSLQGDVALFGAFGEGSGTGAVYVYRFDGSTWAEEQKLTASDGEPSDLFGSSVALDGDVALIAARQNGGGTAYVFRFDGASWVEEQILSPSDGGAFDGFGWSLGVHGDVALVGSRNHASQAGAAYVFRFDGSSWVEEEKLTASDGNSFDTFGAAVSLHGDVAVVGADNDDDAGDFAGSAYVFRFDGANWSEEQKLIPGDIETDDNFGNAISLEGDLVLIGSVDDESRTGVAYVYRFDGAAWVEEQKLVAGDGEAGDVFGQFLSLSGNRALISARGDDGQTGAAYLFRFGGGSWVEAQKLVASDGLPGDLFGSVALDGLRAVVGASRDNVSGQSAAGSAYVFQADCRAGAVNAGNGLVINVLFIEVDMGGVDRTVETGASDFIDVTVLQPADAGSGAFVLHANLGEANPAVATVLPFDIGLTCFPLFLTQGAAPVIVANNIGKRNLVGESHFLGVPRPDPERASTSFTYPPLPLGSVLTFQGVIIDTGSASPRGASATNAVILKVL